MRGRFLLIGALGAGIAGAAAAAVNSPGLARLNLTEAELSAEQARNRHQLARLLSVLEQLRRDPPPMMLVPPGQAKDAVRAAILVKAMAPMLQARAQGYAQGAAEVMR